MLWPLLVIACLSLNAASGSIPNSTKSLQRPSRDQKGKNPESCSQCYKTFLLENLENFISPKCETGRIGQLEPINSFLLFRYWPVWPNWAIYWTLGNILKPLAKINLPKSSTFLGNFCKGVIFLVISFLGNFYRHLSIFFWSHWYWSSSWDMNIHYFTKWPNLSCWNKMNCTTGM